MNKRKAFFLLFTFILLLAFGLEIFVSNGLILHFEKWDLTVWCLQIIFVALLMFISYVLIIFYDQIK